MKQLKINNSKKDSVMKKLFLTVVTCITITSFAKTLDEVKSEYTDGTEVYSFRYDGIGSNRLRYDTVKLPSGKVTIIIVEDPEIIVNKKDTINKDNEWKNNGSLVFATTNRHGVIHAVFEKNNDYTIETKDTKQKKDKKFNSIKKKLLKSATNNTNDTKKAVWKYTNDDIESYVRNNPSLTNRILKTVNANKSFNKLVGDSIITNRTRRLRNSFDSPTYDGGYYIMTDGNVISYRVALNYGWANLPTNDLQQAVFDEVTSDPNSLWTKRTIFHDNPSFKKVNKSYRSPSKSFYIR